MADPLDHESHRLAHILVKHWSQGGGVFVVQTVDIAVRVGRGEYGVLPKTEFLNVALFSRK